MKKSLKIVIVILLLMLFISAVFGYVTYHDNGIYQAMQEQIAVSDKTVELQKGEVEISINDVVNLNDLDCTALFENGNNKLTINAEKVNEQPVKIIVTANNTLFFDKMIELNVKIRIADTTPPEFTKSVDEIKITEGDELDILNKFQAEDISGNVDLTVKGDSDNTKVGNHTITVIAKDVNGNVTEKEVEIIVNEKVVASSNNSSSSRNTNNSSNTGSSSSSSSPSNSNNNSSSNNGGGSSSNSNQHTASVGNIGKWFNSQSEVENYWKQVDAKYFSQYESGAMTYEEYSKKSPYGYECWSCSHCGKWTGNFKYR